MVHLYPPKVPNSYKYQASGTYATITRGGSAWYLTDVHRGPIGSKSYGGNWQQAIQLTEQQQLHLVNSSDLYSEVTALPNSAFDPQVLYRLRQDPKLLDSLRVIEINSELDSCQKPALLEA